MCHYQLVNTLGQPAVVRSDQQSRFDLQSGRLWRVGIETNWSAGKLIITIDADHCRSNTVVQFGRYLTNWCKLDQVVAPVASDEIVWERERAASWKIRQRVLSTYDVATKLTSASLMSESRRADSSC